MVYLKSWFWSTSQFNFFSIMQYILVKGNVCIISQTEGHSYPKIIKSQSMFWPAGTTAKGCQSVPKTVEVYNPHTKKICKLSDLPYGVYGHTLCGGLLCGGYATGKSCLKLGPAGFVKATVSLQQSRRYHLCWNVPEGVLLLGGQSSPSSTELVLRDGSASVSEFKLTHHAR